MMLLCNINKYINENSELFCRDYDKIGIYNAFMYTNKKKNNKEVFDEENPPDYYRYYVIPIKNLRNFIDKYSHIIPVKRGGDGKRTQGYCIPERCFNKYLHVNTK